MKRSVLISTYGNPWRKYPPTKEDDYSWRKVVYRLDSGEETSRTTLPLLYEFYKPDRVLVVVQDTVVYGDVGTYTELLTHVENIYRDFIVNEGCGGSCEGIEERLTIIVAPGIGRYTLNGKETVELEVCGDPADFYAHVTTKLAVELLRELRNPPPEGVELDVVLDLSHGINYMPVLTYKAVKEVLSVTSLSPYLKTVRLKVHNVDPFTSNQTKIYTINTVEDATIKKENELYITPSLEALDNLKIVALNERCGDQKIASEIYNNAKNLVETLFADNHPTSAGLEKTLSAFAGSIVNGLPLVTLYTIPQTDVENLYQETIKLYHKYIQIEKPTQTSLRIKRAARIRANFVALTKILLASRIIRDTLKINAPEKEPTLRTLKDLKEKIFSTNERTQAIIGNELDILEQNIPQPKTCEDECGDGWLSLRCVTKGEEERCVKKGEEETQTHKRVNINIDRRNFLAHAGLERNATCYKYDANSNEPKDKKIRLKYLEQHLKEIYEYAQSGLQRIK